MHVKLMTSAPGPTSEKSGSAGAPPGCKVPEQGPKANAGMALATIITAISAATANTKSMRLNALPPFAQGVLFGHPLSTLLCDCDRHREVCIWCKWIILYRPTRCCVFDKELGAASIYRAYRAAGKAHSRKLARSLTRRGK